MVFCDFSMVFQVISPEKHPPKRSGVSMVIQKREAKFSDSFEGKQHPNLTKRIQKEQSQFEHEY